MEEEKKAASEVTWTEKAPSKGRHRSHKKNSPAPAAGESKTETAAKPEALPAESPQPETGKADEVSEPTAPACPEKPETPETAVPAEASEPTESAAPAGDAPEEPPEKSSSGSDPAELDEYTFREESSAGEEAPAEKEVDTSEEAEADPEETPEEKERAASISRTAQLSIAQIMAELADSVPDPPPEEMPSVTPEPSADEGSEEEPEDTIPQKIGRGAFGMFKWLLLVVLFVLIIAGGGVAWLYRSATPDMLPEIKVTFDGQEVGPTAYKWHVPVVGHWFRRTYAETISSSPIVLDTPVSGASPDLIISPSGYSSTLTITDADQQQIYDGSASGFRSYLFTENGTFDAKLVVKAQDSGDDTAGVTGSETWQFQFTVSIRPSFQLCTATVQQGGVAAVRVGSTLGENPPSIETSLKNTGFVKAANGWICYLPIPWNQQTGDMDLTVKADGYTETMTLSIRAASYSYKDYSRTSQMTAPYIGENDAPAAVSKLFSTADDTIQWSVGGFVQPFLDSFETLLTYGMTEYAGRSYSERGTNYGYGGRTSTNVVLKPKSTKGSMIVPASGRVLLAEDLGDIYGNTVVIEHGAGLKSIFYGLGSLEVKTGDKVKQGQLLGSCGKTVVAEMRIGTVPIDPLAVWRSQCDGLKNY